MIHLYAIAILYSGIILLYIVSYRDDYYKITITNCILLLLYISILRFYIVIKKGYSEKFLNKYIGTGDIITLTVFSFVYSTFNYIVFILLSCIVGLIFAIVSQKSKNKKPVYIPLAGILTISHLTIMLYSKVLNINSLRDTLFQVSPIFNP